MRRRSRARLVGTDVNTAPIEWCRRKLPIGEFHVNGLEPPLAFASGTFDLVYAFSVFTHLPEPLQRPWLEDLTRVLRPGGRLLFTTQGSAYEVALRESERRHLHETGLVVLGAELPGSNRCLVYHTPQYVERMVGGLLELRRFERGMVIDPDRRLVGQDAYLARRLDSLAASNRLEPGALVLLDDFAYCDYPESKRAMDACSARLGIPIVTLPTGQGLLVRPPH